MRNKSKEMIKFDLDSATNKERNLIQNKKLKQSIPVRLKTKNMFEDEIQEPKCQKLDEMWMRKSNQHFYREQQKYLEKDKVMYEKKKKQQQLLDNMVRQSMERKQRQQK